jgi:ABC-type Co2+ transport system permease subunit
MDYNFREIMKRVMKYLVEALVVALACYAIPKKSMDLEEVALIALVAAATFSILDTYMPRL